MQKPRLVVCTYGDYRVRLGGIRRRPLSLRSLISFVLERCTCLLSIRTSHEEYR